MNLRRCLIRSMSVLVCLFFWKPSPYLQAQDPTRFEGDILAYEALDRQQPPPDHPVVFVGSSSIRMWPDLPANFPDYPVLNRGFGGSTMSDLLYYFDRLVTAYQPALVVVYEGDNDLSGGRSVDTVFEDFATFVALLEDKLPETDFAFISVKPSPSRAAILGEMQELNARLETLAQEHQGFFMDVYAVMVDQDGNPLPKLFSSDNLHMNAAGYRLWRKTITPILDQWDTLRSTPAHFTTFSSNGSTLLLEWQGRGQLEAADNPNGPWTPITPTTPGRHSETLAAPKKFYRLASPQ